MSGEGEATKPRVPRKKKESPIINFRFRIDGVYYDDPPLWFKQHLGKVISNAFSG